MTEFGKELRDEVVVEPRPSKLAPKIHDSAIFCPVGPLVSLAATMYGARKKLLPLMPAQVYTVKKNGRRVSLAGPGMGAPMAVYVLERLIANGARNVIMLGVAGSLSPQVRIGDLVVPTEALIEEGVSGHYAAGVPRSSASTVAIAALTHAVSAAGKTCHQGPIWTTDALYRETKAKVRRYGQEGILAVEMEVSALFTVARYRGIDLAALLVISDEVFDLRWRLGWTNPRFLAAQYHAANIALAAACRLAEENPPQPPR